MGDETNKRRRRDLFLPLFDGEALLNSLFSLDLAHSELILSFVLIFLIKPLFFFIFWVHRLGGRVLIWIPYLRRCEGASREKNSEQNP